MNPVNFLEGPQIDLTSFHEDTPFYTYGDFVNYIARLKRLPQQVILLKNVKMFLHWIMLNKTRKTLFLQIVASGLYRAKCVMLFSTIWIHKQLKLYCRYEYTRSYMINRIWSLKQLWHQVNGHAWFHLHGLRWPVRNGEGAKNSKWKYMSPAGFEPTPCQSTTGKSAP